MSTSAPPSFSANPWQTLGFDAHALNPVRSMITDDETRYLHWLTRDVYTGAGAIVDAGPLLGGSTVTMAEGLRQNRRVPRKAGRIHSYDLFTYYSSYMRGLFPNEPEPSEGESLLPRFLAHTEPWRESIQVYPGDVQQYTWTGGPIEILFIDLAKSWDLQAHLLREFFPHLIPGISVIVQQDYFFHGCPWIHVVMERLSEYCTPIHVTDGPTLGFSLDKAIPPGLLGLDYERLVSAHETEALMDRAATRFSGSKRLVTLTAKVLAMLQHDAVDTAAATLEAIRRSSDYDDTVAPEFQQISGHTMRRLTRDDPTVSAGSSRHVHAHPAAPRAYGQPVLGRGLISVADAQFIRTLVAETRPDVVVEVGVASDDAGSALLDALGAVAAERAGEPITLHSFILANRGHVDEAAVDDAPVETASGAVRRVVHAASSTLDGPRLIGDDRATLAFIDGHHYHPWPTADLLALLPRLAPGAWVILHDVRLPFLSADQLWGHGPARLFDAWPGEKRQGGSVGNVGAIRLPQDLASVPSLVARALKEAWEVAPPFDLCATLGMEPDPITSSGIRAVQLMQRAVANGRPLYLWGAGQSGRNLLALLRDYGVTVAGFVDSDQGKHGLLVDELPVSAPSSLARESRPRPFVGVSGMFAREIAASLHTAGWHAEADYAIR